LTGRAGRADAPRAEKFTEIPHTFESSPRNPHPTPGIVASITARAVRPWSTARMLINLILRVLPWWIREPLVIAVSLFFCGLAFYWTVTDGGWARFGIGVLFLAVAALRIHILRGELRSWQAARSPAGAPPAADHS